MLWFFDVNPVEIGIVSLSDLGAVELRAADEEVN